MLTYISSLRNPNKLSFVKLHVTRSMQWLHVLTQWMYHNVLCHIITLLSITDNCHKIVCFIYPSLCYRCRLPSPALLLHRGWTTLYNMDGLDQLLLGFFGISGLKLQIYGIIYVICLTCHSVGLLPSIFSNKVSSPATKIDRYLHILLHCAPTQYSKHLTKHCFSVKRFILNLQQPLRNLPSMFEPFTVITALTVTAATFGILSIISDYCLNYYKLMKERKTGKLFFPCVPILCYHIEPTICWYVIYEMSPLYTDIFRNNVSAYFIFLSTKTETFANITKLLTFSK